MRKFYEGFVKSFMNRIFLLFCPVLYTAERDVRYSNSNFQKIWGARAAGPPGSSDATPMALSQYITKFYLQKVIRVDQLKTIINN